MSLNPEQNRAVQHRGSGLLVLAGAGTGKTRVITHRVADLINDGVDPKRIVTVTFTNKAAKEMRGRLEKMGVKEGAWIGTFHATGLRILRMHAEELGYLKGFTIYDSDAQETIVKSLLASCPMRGADKLSPGAVHSYIEKAKGAGLTHQEIGEADIPAILQKIVGEIFRLYQLTLKKSNAMDFADLLVNTNILLRRGERSKAAWLLRQFQYVLVDEFQDTNKIQMDMVDLLATNGEICVVGDDDQCLVQGTLVTLEDGAEKPIEEIARGDRVLSCYGSGDFRGATVKDVFCKLQFGRLVRVTLASGNTLVSTPEHTHFAGYRLGLSPQTYVTYLMHRRDMGWRIGVSRVNAGAAADTVLGFAQRCAQERGDAVWVISAHTSENEARLDEYVTSLEYQIPTLPFVPRKGGSTKGLVHDVAYLKRVFVRIDSEKGALRLLEDRGLVVERPHYRPRSRNSSRRNVVVTLCGDRRGRTPMHRISIVGNDDEGREKLTELGFSVRSVRKGSSSWRVETVLKDFGAVQGALTRMGKAFEVQPLFNARFGKNPNGVRGKNSLPFLPADSVMPGMVMFKKDGAYDVVKRVEAFTAVEQVYDLNVDSTHNFVANGVVTHNSIYGWRGADPKGMFDFAKRPGVEIVRLEENYRSTTAILDCANAVITRNASRLGKTLWTEKRGEPVRVVELRDERKEAEYVASRIAGPHWRNYAVLYRTHAQSRPFEEAFRRHGIPYTIVGGLRFYDRAEIKDMMAYFRLAVNPKSDVDLLRIANRPARGAGAKKIGKLKTAAADQGISLFEALKTAKDPKLTALYEVLVSLRKATHAASLFDFYTHVLRKTGYRDALVKTSQESGSIAQREKAQTRIANVDELASDIETFERDHPDATVMQYLEHVALVSSADKETGPVVSLMTIHAAKGLEFPHVFAVGFEENLLPHLNSLRAYDRDRDVSHIEEECRLAYVAVTRAMERLDITHATARMLAGRSKLARPSRFLSALPDKRIERLNLIL